MWYVHACLNHSPLTWKVNQPSWNESERQIIYTMRDKLLQKRLKTASSRMPFLLKDQMQSSKPTSEVWTHALQQPTLLMTNPCLTISFPAFFLRALRLNVHLQAKTQGLPCLGKFRLICTTTIQLVYLIMTWRQNETMQQCFIQNLKTICKEQPLSLTCLRESFMKKTKRSVMREIIWPQ